MRIYQLKFFCPALFFIFLWAGSSFAGTHCSTKWNGPDCCVETNSYSERLLIQQSFTSAAICIPCGMTNKNTCCLDCLFTFGILNYQAIQNTGGYYQPSLFSSGLRIPTLNQASNYSFLSSAWNHKASYKIYISNQSLLC